MAVAAALFACASPIAPDRASLVETTFAALPGWRTDAHGEAVPAFRRSCQAFATKPPSATLGPGASGGTVASWSGVCRALALVPAGDDRAAREFFERWFTPYRVMAVDGDDEGLFTGYFEPTLAGARRTHGRFTVPIYRRPPDLVTVEPGAFRVAPRAEIEAGALVRRGLELVWVDDAVDAFFLHIQGSGRIILRDGSVLRVGFAGSNGHPYTAIGAVLVAEGAIARERVSMPSIRAWLKAHPRAARGVMARNARYVFFRELTGAAPLGAQGVALTAGRSIAVDRRFLLLGAPLWLDATDALARTPPLQRLMVAQDTGVAIRGAVRGDVFWGHGARAARRAGLMNQRGRYFLLLPKGTRASSE